MKEKEIYKVIVETQPYCQICGVAQNLHIHHIRYGACGRKTYLGNLIRLCANCHDMVHKNKKKWQPVLIEKVNLTHDTCD